MGTIQKNMKSEREILQHMLFHISSHSIKETMIKKSRERKDGSLMNSYEASWNYFFLTGSVEAYLYTKELEEYRQMNQIVRPVEEASSFDK